MISDFQLSPLLQDFMPRHTVIIKQSMMRIYLGSIQSRQKCIRDLSSTTFNVLCLFLLKLNTQSQNVFLQRICLPTLSKETIEEINKLLKSNPELQKYSNFFLGQLQKEESEKDTKMFGVLCHGNFCRENLLFKYKSNLESRLSCCDVCFQDLSRAHYG